MNRDSDSPASAFLPLLRRWLDTDPPIPMLHGRVDIKRVCKIIGAPTTALWSDELLARALDQLNNPSERGHASGNANDKPNSLSSTFHDGAQRLQDLNRLERQDARKRLLLSRGIVPP